VSARAWQVLAGPRAGLPDSVYASEPESAAEAVVEEDRI